MTDHRRRKWKIKGTTNSIATIQVRPRIVIIAAVDNLGNAYISLLQANTTSEVMKLFLWEFTKLLDAEDSDWRSKTMLMHDNAPYFGSDETK